MAARLDPADLANDDVSKRAEVFDLDPFVIVLPPPRAQRALTKFPVTVTLAPPGSGATILDSARNQVDSTPPGVTQRNTQLPLGLYELLALGVPQCIFKVSGALGPTGQPEVVSCPLSIN